MQTHKLAPLSSAGYHNPLCASMVLVGPDVVVMITMVTMMMVTEEGNAEAEEVWR